MLNMKSSASAVLLSLAAGTSAKDAAKCSPLELIYARATTEPPTGVDNADAKGFEDAAAKWWSKEFGAAGASLAFNLTQLLPEATTYPVHYPASMGQSVSKGVTDLISRITNQAKACPNQKFALGGHSQGGMVTVSAIPKIPKEILDRDVAVTMFGSPACPSAVEDRCNSYCLTGDFVCGLVGTGKSVKGGKGGEGAAAPKESAPPAKEGAPSRRSILEDMALKSMEFTLERRQNRTLADCDKYAPGSIQVTGKETSVNTNAHLAYNTDGYYVYAATCYILDQYKKLGSKSRFRL